MFRVTPLEIGSDKGEELLNEKKGGVLKRKRAKPYQSHCRSENPICRIASGWSSDVLSQIRSDEHPSVRKTNKKTFIFILKTEIDGVADCPL
jgi:hypothetical protein